MIRTINRLKAFISEYVWNIGIVTPIDLSDTEHHMTINWIRDIPSSSWYADPFILQYDENKIEILAEEYIKQSKKGIISLLTVDAKNYKLIQSQKILELDTHLSFPLIYRDGDKTYILPENYQSGHLTIYEYDSIGKCLINPHIILEEAVVDSSIMKINNVYYLFTTKYSLDFCGGAQDLYIYHSDTISGQYKLLQVIKMDAPIARGAGAIIQDGDEYYIPTQNCQGRYGKQVVINRLNINSDLFSIEEISRISPCDKYDMGCHTYNVSNKIAVIDGYKYKFGWFAKLMAKLYNLYR